ncbi:acyl carrier protein [Buchnera aphidicola]|uniref:acyl carrier protein n=1 Tax=Buchnera aphidicola TaxID=9 RepID=UPI003464A4A6
MNTIDNRIKKIISEQLSIKEKDILNYHSFSKDLGADSLDFIELIMKLEEEFNIEISDKDTEKFSTVKNTIDYIKNILKK